MPRLLPSSIFTPIPQPVLDEPDAEDRLGAALGEQTVPKRLHQHRVQPPGPRHQDRVGPHGPGQTPHRLGPPRRHPRGVGEPREREGNLADRHPERRDAAAVRAEDHRRAGNTRALADDPCDLLLQRMVRRAVRLDRPPMRAARGEHAGVFARAVVVDAPSARGPRARARRPGPRRPAHARRTAAHSRRVPLWREASARPRGARARRHASHRSPRAPLGQSRTGRRRRTPRGESPAAASRTSAGTAPDPDRPRGSAPGRRGPPRRRRRDAATRARRPAWFQRAGR